MLPRALTSLAKTSLKLAGLWVNAPVGELSESEAELGPACGDEVAQRRGGSLLLSHDGHPAAPTPRSPTRHPAGRVIPPVAGPSQILDKVSMELNAGASVSASLARRRRDFLF